MSHEGNAETNDTIIDWLTENEIMKLTEAQIHQIPDLIKVGKRQDEIAVLFSCSVRTIQYWIKRWRAEGIKIKVKQGRPKLKLMAE